MPSPGDQPESSTAAQLRIRRMTTLSVSDTKPARFEHLPCDQLPPSIVSRNAVAMGSARAPATTGALVPPRVAVDSVYNPQLAPDFGVGVVVVPILTPPNPQRAATFPARVRRDPTRLSCGRSLYPGSTYSASVIVAPPPGFVREKVRAFASSLGGVKQRLRKRLSSLLRKRKDSGNAEDNGEPTDARATVYRQFDQNIFSTERRAGVTVAEDSVSPHACFASHIEDAELLEPLLPSHAPDAGLTEEPVVDQNEVRDLENDSGPGLRSSSLAPTESDDEDCEEYRLYRVIDTLRNARGRQGCPFFDNTPPPEDRVANLEGYRRQECLEDSPEQMVCPTHRLHPLFGPSEEYFEAIYSIGAFAEELIDERFRDIREHTEEWVPGMPGIEDKDIEAEDPTAAELKHLDRHSNSPQGPTSLRRK